MFKRLLSAAVLFVLSATVVAWAGVMQEGDEFQVNTWTTYSQFRPAVAADRKGNFVVVWTCYPQDGDRNGIFAQRFNRKGNPVGLEFRVNTRTADDQEWASVAMNASRRFVVTWTGYGQDGDAGGIFGQRFNRKGRPAGPEFQVNTTTSGGQWASSVAMDASSNFVVVWTSDDGDDQGIFGQRFDLRGDPVGSEFMVNTYTTLDQVWPSVSMNEGGSFVVVWESRTGDGSHGGVFGQRFDSAGAAVDGEFQVNTYTTDSQREPTVAMKVDGSFVVVWQSWQQDGDEEGVFMQRFDSSGSMVGGEFQVNAYTLYDQGGSKVAVDASGEFMVVYHSNQDGSAYAVLGQLFDSTGATSGAEFLVNTYTTLHQQVPAVASGPEGTFIVVWESNGQDGDYSGVFGQRISAHSPTLTSLGPVDCTDPANVQPTFTWETDGHERFKVFMSRDDRFSTGGTVSSGDERITTGTWTPRAGKWRRACNKIDPQIPVMYIKVMGLDTDLPKWNINRRQSSPTVQVSVQP